MPDNTNSTSARGFLVAAPSSGAGKTTLTLALLRALRNSGRSVVSAKSGPDYIDPKFHEAASGRPCVNLDAWAMDTGTIRSLAGEQAAGADLLLVGANGALCSHCLVDVARSRKEHLETDPEAVCALSRRSAFEARAMYRFRGVVVCREVLDDGLGRLEREAVDRYLAAL